MGQAMHTDAFRAIVSLPVAMTDAHIVRCAFTMPIAGISALCFHPAQKGHAQQRGENQKYPVSHKEEYILYKLSFYEFSTSHLAKKSPQTVARCEAIGPVHSSFPVVSPPAAWEGEGWRLIHFLNILDKVRL